MSVEECRLCGNLDLPKIKLSDKIKGFLSFKEFVEYFCRIDLDDKDTKLPDSVCSECYNILIKFCIFTVNVEKLQNKFKNRLPKQDNIATSQKRKPEENVNHPENSNHETQNNSSPSKKRKIEENTVSEKSDNIHQRNLSDCIREVNRLFKDELNTREKQYEKVTIKESLLLDGGEIPKKWLERYRDFVTWQDFVYQCCHCNNQIKGFNSLLKHFDEFKIPSNKRYIKCTCCEKMFKDNIMLTSYLNHVAKVHYTHLKFTCLFCSKVFVNVVKLSHHIDQSHGKTNLKIFPCFDCGLKCSSLDRLKQHKGCHEV